MLAHSSSLIEFLATDQIHSDKGGEIQVFQEESDINGLPTGIPSEDHVNIQYTHPRRNRQGSGGICLFIVGLPRWDCLEGCKEVMNENARTEHYGIPRVMKISPRVCEFPRSDWSCTDRHGLPRQNPGSPYRLGSIGNQA